MFKKGLGLVAIIALLAVVALSSGLLAWDKSTNKTLSGYVQIKGSDTIVNLAQILAERYMQYRPKVAVAVTGGGSGAGIAALLNKQIDIADSSRDIKQSEVDQAKKKGVNPVPFVIGMDGVSFIVSESNAVKELTIEQLGKIYRGEITNWKEVGGKDQAITLYGRQSNSGTFAFVQEFVLKGDYSQKMMGMNGNAQIVEAVKADKGGIGYVGVAYVKDEKGQEVPGLNVLMAKKDANSKAYSPLDTKAVEAGLYPVARELFQYTNGKPTGVVKDWLEFVLSEEGQKIVEAEGFFKVPANHAATNAANLK